MPKYTQRLDNFSLKNKLSESLNAAKNGITAPILSSSKNDVRRMKPIKKTYLVLFFALIAEKILKIISKKLDSFSGSTMKYY